MLHTDQKPMPLHEVGHQPIQTIIMNTHLAEWRFHTNSFVQFNSNMEKDRL